METFIENTVFLFQLRQGTSNCQYCHELTEVAVPVTSQRQTHIDIRRDLEVNVCVCGYHILQLRINRMSQKLLGTLYNCKSAKRPLKCKFLDMGKGALQQHERFHVVLT